MNFQPSQLRSYTTAVSSNSPSSSSQYPKSKSGSISHPLGASSFRDNHMSTTETHGPHRCSQDNPPCFCPRKTDQTGPSVLHWTFIKLCCITAWPLDSNCAARVDRALLALVTVGCIVRRSSRMPSPATAAAISNTLWTSHAVQRSLRSTHLCSIRMLFTRRVPTRTPRRVLPPASRSTIFVRPRYPSIHESPA